MSCVDEKEGDEMISKCFCGFDNNLHVNVFRTKMIEKWLFKYSF